MMTDGLQNRVSRREVVGALAVGAAAALVPCGFAADAAAHFLVVGDWGRDGHRYQREVADQMAQTAARVGAHHVISVGDNFYESGVQSKSDAQWQSSFEAIYTAASLQIPWFVALGNHDYLGVPQAQIDYAAISSRWRMPSRYYKVSGADIGMPQLDLFVIDTSPLVHQYRQDVHSVLAANVATQDVAAQLQWLDDALVQSTAPWRLVVGHHTIYSGGSGHGNTQELINLVEPLLRKHGVQAYLNGHDHDLQHIRRNGIDYVCSGAGSEARPVKPVEGTRFCAARSGFAVFRSSSNSLSFEYRDVAGAMLYQADIPRDVRIARY